MNIVFFKKDARIQLSLRERDKTKYIKLNPGRLIIMKKVIATVLAAVSVLSSMAVVSAGAYEWSAKSDTKLGQYITGKYCSKATNFKSTARSNSVKYDVLTLNKNDQTTVRYLSNDNRIRWRVQAGSWNTGVYCDMLKDDKKYSVNVWAPQFNTVSIMSLSTDWNGKSKSQVVKNGYATEIKSRSEVDWFQSLKSGAFYAKYSTKGFDLSGSIK